MFTTPGLKTFAQAVDDERQRQLAKWGDQHHPNGTGSPYYEQRAAAARRDCQYAAADPDVGAQWALILLEEVYEALAETDPDLLEAELVQVAAVAQAWIADLHSRRAAGEAR